MPVLMHDRVHSTLQGVQQCSAAGLTRGWTRGKPEYPILQGVTGLKQCCEVSWFKREMRQCVERGPSHAGAPPRLWVGVGATCP